MDLATRKPVTVKLAPDSQMRKLPEPMAQRIAMFLRRGGAGAGAGAEENQHAASSRPGEGTGAVAGNGRLGSPPDFQQLIRRMPPATISDLQKGEAVMMVTTPGAEPTALTLLSGVEPILTAAPNQTTAANLLSGWSMGGGGEGDAASQ
jgi:hypothetical protein